MDDNQNLVVSGLRQMGASVAITSTLGAGFPDLVVGFRGKNYLIEVKDGEKFPSQRALTEAEEQFRQRWLGQYDVVESAEEAIALIRWR